MCVVLEAEVSITLRWEEVYCSFGDVADMGAWVDGCAVQVDFFELLCWGRGHCRWVWSSLKDRIGSIIVSGLTIGLGMRLRRANGGSG